MAASKKLYSGYTEVTNNQLTDQVPILQNGNKKTTLQKVYSLFKTSFDEVYATAASVDEKQDKQSTSVIGINAQGGSTLVSANCILSISNIPSGTGNKQITINTGGFLNDGDFLQLTVKYNGFDVNLRSYTIENGTLKLFINVHSSPTEPVIISMNKIN